MKFVLTYDGDLKAQGNNSNRVKDKWAIRQHLSPQLKHLWESHPTLIHSMTHFRNVPKNASYWMGETHHESNYVHKAPTGPKEDEIDLCASIPVRGVNFRPLVRRSFALACSLNILFLRNGKLGDVYSGGDLDNRIKTLLDALTVPHPDQLQPTDEKHIYCVLEDDKLITSLNVNAQSLLARPQETATHVRLIIEVEVKVTTARSYNFPFLGE